MHELLHSTVHFENMRHARGAIRGVVVETTDSIDSRCGYAAGRLSRVDCFRMPFDKLRVVFRLVVGGGLLLWCSH